MDKTKKVTIAKKVEALAIGFIGVCFFSMGTTYFQERLVYRMPRILVPVYELLGPIGLAVAMMLLGIGVIVWGFTKWKSADGKPAIYLIPAVALLVLGVFLANVYNAFESSEERKASKEQTSGDFEQRMKDNHQKQIDDVKKTERPKLKNAAVDKYFDDYDLLYAKLENAVSLQEAEALDEEFMQWIRGSSVGQQIKNNDQRYEFSKYNAKLSVQWHEKMQEFRQN